MACRGKIFINPAFLTCDTDGFDLEKFVKDLIKSTSSTDVVIPPHNMLQGLQGGSVDERFHLTFQQYEDLLNMLYPTLPPISISYNTNKPAVVNVFSNILNDLSLTHVAKGQSAGIIRYETYEEQRTYASTGSTIISSGVLTPDYIFNTPTVPGNVNNYLRERFITSTEGIGKTYTWYSKVYDTNGLFDTSVSTSVHVVAPILSGYLYDNHTNNLSTSAIVSALTSLNITDGGTTTPALNLFRRTNKIWNNTIVNDINFNMNFTTLSQDERVYLILLIPTYEKGFASYDPWRQSNPSTAQPQLPLNAIQQENGLYSVGDQFYYAGTLSVNLTAWGVGNTVPYRVYVTQHLTNPVSRVRLNFE